MWFRIAAALIFGSLLVVRSSAQLAAPAPVAPAVEKAKAAAEEAAKAATEAAAAAKDAAEKAVPADQPVVDKPAPDRKDTNLKRLSPNWDVWLDVKNKRVVMEATVCLTEGQLEMFACTKRTKEHESVLTVLTSAQAVHAALIAVGAKPGKPVAFDPMYVPASGQEIEVELTWTDDKGKEHKARAQDWIKDAKTEKPMTHPFVFAGSGFYVDENTGKRHYLADSGDFICVSNFSSAMLDLPVKSTDQNDSGLLFDAMTDKIPAKGTRVTMTLIPVPVKEAKPAEPMKSAEPAKSATPKAKQ
jgi:hypothetical protein